MDLAGLCSFFESCGDTGDARESSTGGASTAGDRCAFLPRCMSVVLTGMNVSH